jgi:two-component system, LytTR family, response regulator
LTLRVIIADDEPLAVRRLQIALDAMPEIEVVGSAGDGEEALRMINALSPDIVLLDIRMPELSGLQLVEALDHPSPPAVIFITAYDSFAVEAFREGAVDYLLKPLDEERLRIAIERAQQSLETRDARQRIAELRSALASLQLEEAAREKRSYEEYLWVSSRGHVIRVPVSDVHWFEAEGDYVTIHASDKTHLIHDSLRDLESRLDPGRFLRVHRSAIVAIQSVAGLERSDFGAVRLRLVDGAQVPVSRSYKKATLAGLGV